MAPVIPDCGIFSTPRREPRLRLLEEGLQEQLPQSPATPNLSRLILSSSQDATGASNSSSTSGISLDLYKSPKASSGAHKSPKVLPQKATPSMAGYRRKKAGEVNKGVGHCIKKPKIKTIVEKKKKKVEETRKIRKKTPCIPANRSPLKSPPSQKKKLQYLSPPGVSLLNSQVPKESFLPEPPSGKFFTSRSRAAATVQISKNIKLSAKYGDVSLDQKGGGFAKKNIGRLVEEKLDQYLQQPNFNMGISEVSPLPSVQTTTRPAPTRVPSSPSPTKKTTQHKARASSPKKKGTSTSTKRQLSTPMREKLQDMELIMKEWEENDEDSYNKSPRKLNRVSTPTRRSPRKGIGSSCSSPARKSPRKWMGSSCASPGRKSPRKQAAMNHTLLKESPQKQKQETTSPSKESHASQAVAEKVDASPIRKSPRKRERMVLKELGEGEEPAVLESPSKKVKYFPIFYPKTRLSDCKFPRDKNGARGKKSALDIDDAQMMIDAGQKEFGAQHCKACGMMFEVGNHVDETAHKNYHDHLSRALKYHGWKKEKLARELDHLGGRVVVVSGQDPHLWWQKVEEVRQVVDNELGFSENSIKTRENTKVFLYVLDHQMVGCLIAEKIDNAYRIVPQKSQYEGSGRLVCCSWTSTKVWVGISRVWVLQAHRGRGIATTLVDAMRDNMIKNHILTMDQFAFSDPTEVGLSFAKKYTGRPDFLVYRREF